MSGNSGLGMRVGAALACAVFAAAQAAPLSAQAYVGKQAESPADAMARNVKILATNPREFSALIGAGKAALALGDGQAAAGFFGRAEEVWPANPQPQVGMGAALALEGDAAAAMQYFARAAELGASRQMLGLDRGLAHDLLGRHADAQADYRAAMAGPDADEARRRLALSLAISGKKQDALNTLAPLMAKGDAAGARCRAFVLALSGDPAGARAALDAAMPGMGSQMAYFFHRLPSLSSPQKAAAVHIGSFPETTQLAGSAAPLSAGIAGASVASPTADRLDSIDELLRQGTPSAVQQPSPRRQPPQRTQVASVNRPTTATIAAQGSASAGQVYAERKIWLQLASGNDAAALPAEFRRMKSRNKDLFDGISGHVAEDGKKARLLIGPFRGRDDARIFAEDLASVSIDSFSWTNAPGQIIRKLPSE